MKDVEINEGENPNVKYVFKYGGSGFKSWQKEK
jgi:hypothetical protein